MAKSKDNIQEKETKTKPKKTKKVIETEKVEKSVDEKIDDVKVNDVQVDVEIDCRSYSHSDVIGGYIRRKRSI